MISFMSGILGNILWVVSIICIIWIIYDVLARNRRLSMLMKLVWIVLALVFTQYSILIAIIYCLVYRR